MPKDLRDIIRQYSISILKNDPKWKHRVKINNPNSAATTGTQSNDTNPMLATVSESAQTPSLTTENGLHTGDGGDVTAAGVAPGANVNTLRCLVTSATAAAPEQEIDLQETTTGRQAKQAAQDVHRSKRKR